MITMQYLLDKYGDWTPFVENAKYECYLDNELQQEMVLTLNEEEANYAQAMEKRLRMKTF